MTYTKPPRFTRWLATLSQSLNVAIYDGHEDEMLSARAYREGWKLRAWLDWLFGLVGQKSHCRECHKWETERRLYADRGRE